MTHTQSEDSIKIAITDFLTDSSGDEECRELLVRLAEDPKAGEIFRDLSLAWALASSSVFSSNEDKELRNIHRRIKRHNNRRRLAVLAIGTAAALALVFAISTVFLIIDKHRLHETYTGIARPYEISVPAGSRTEISLPDGTTVTLNSGSRLTYPRDFGITERIVTLNGEGLFHVAKDEGQPFSGLADKVFVEVTGTTFNVEAYDDDDAITVSLIEGSVRLKDSYGRTASLRPDEQARYDKATGIMTIRAADLRGAASWTEGTLTFINEPFTSIARKMSRHFGISIIINSEHLKGQYYTATFRGNKTLDEILREIDVEDQYTWNEENGAVIISDKSY